MIRKKRRTKKRSDHRRGKENDPDLVKRNEIVPIPEGVLARVPERNVPVPEGGHAPVSGHVLETESDHAQGSVRGHVTEREAGQGTGSVQDPETRSVRGHVTGNAPVRAADAQKVVLTGTRRHLTIENQGITRPLYLL